MSFSRAVAASAVAAFGVFLSHQQRGLAFFVGKPAVDLRRTVYSRGLAAGSISKKGRRAGVVHSRLTATMTPEQTDTVSVLNDDGTRKSGEQIREEFFMAAMTGQERGLPPGS
ncbi:unnamed protein product, partial [Ectocarpus sp. 12 AP-2014]